MALEGGESLAVPREPKPKALPRVAGSLSDVAPSPPAELSSISPGLASRQHEIGRQPKKKGLDTVSAYKASVDLAPAYSMRGRHSFGSMVDQKKADEGGMAGDMSSKYDQIRPRAPSYSMFPRSSGIVKTKDSPGPGEYTLPSTIYGSHPQLPVPGRVAGMKEKRSVPQDQLGSEMKKNPSPQDYEVVKTVPGPEHKFGRVDQATAPKYTMRGKTSFGSLVNSKKAQEGGMSGDMSSKYDQIRPRAPAYSMPPRSSGIVKTKDSPGPGEYTVPSTMYGSHPQLPVPGRVAATKVKRSTPEDQLGGEMKKNPSPQDYEVVKTVAGPEHKFGRADQETAPRYTMRAKTSFGSLINTKKAQEGGMAGDMSSKYDQIRPRAPSYSMFPRSSGIVKTKDSPGPGEYTLPSTIYGSHPQLPVPGRVAGMKEKRSVPQDQLGAEMKKNPSPQDYEVVKTVPGPEHKFGRVDQATAPKYTMRGKTSFGSLVNSKKAQEGGMSGDMSSKYDQIRPRAPAYSMPPRSSGIVKTKDSPGPGEYRLPSTLYGSHPQLKVPGRVALSTQDRFPTPKESEGPV